MGRATRSHAHHNSPDGDRQPERNNVGEFPQHVYDEATRTWVPADEAGDQ